MHYSSIMVSLLTLMFLLCLLHLCMSMVNPGANRANKIRRITMTLGQKRPEERADILRQTWFPRNAPTPAFIVEPNAHWKQQQQTNFGPKNIGYQAQAKVLAILNQARIGEQERLQQQQHLRQQQIIQNSQQHAPLTATPHHGTTDYQNQTHSPDDLSDGWVDSMLNYDGFVLDQFQHSYPSQFGDNSISDSEWVERYNVDMYDDAQSKSAATSLLAHQHEQPESVAPTPIQLLDRPSQGNSMKRKQQETAIVHRSEEPSKRKIDQADQNDMLQIEAHFVKQNGSYLLVNDGFVYTIIRRDSENMNKTTWKCEVEKCMANVHVQKKRHVGANIVTQTYKHRPKKFQHNHEPTRRLSNEPWINEYNSIVENPGQPSGKDSQFVHEGYKYKKEKNREKGRIAVRCRRDHHIKTVPKCPARGVLHTTINWLNWLDVTKPHNHEPENFSVKAIGDKQPPS